MEIRGYQLHIQENCIYASSLNLRELYYYRLNSDSLIKELLQGDLTESDKDLIIDSICCKRNKIKY